MNNRIAVTLGLLIIALLVIDLVLFDARDIVFLGKKLFDMMEWMAFWR